MDLQVLINQAVSQTKPQGTPISSETEKKEIKTEITNLETATVNDEGMTPSQGEAENKKVEKDLSNIALANKFRSDMRAKYKGGGLKGDLSQNEFEVTKFKIENFCDKLTGQYIYDSIVSGSFTYKPETQQVFVVEAKDKDDDESYGLQGVRCRDGSTAWASQTEIKQGLANGTIMKTPDGAYRQATQEELDAYAKAHYQDDLKDIQQTDSAEFKNSQTATTEYTDTKMPVTSTEKASNYAMGNTDSGNAILRALRDLLAKDNSVSPSTPISNATLNSMKRKAIEKEKEPVSWDSFYKTEKVNGKEVQTVSSDFTERILTAGYEDNGMGYIIDDLTDKITSDIIETYGAKGITDIAIKDNRIFINGIWYKPTLDTKADYSNMPKGEYLVWLGQGRVANFFNWKYVKKFSKLYSVSIDDPKYLHTVIAHTACKNGQAGVNTLFRLNDNLEELTIGSNTITRGKLNTPEAAEIKRESGRSKRSFNLLNGWTLNNHTFLENTDSIQNFGVSSFTNYIHNRGNRGFIRFALGSVARFGLATVTTVFNFNTHLISGVANVFKDGMTPVDEGEI